jgi:hypothetical protein
MRWDHLRVANYFISCSGKVNTKRNVMSVMPAEIVFKTILLFVKKAPNFE